MPRTNLFVHYCMSVYRVLGSACVLDIVRGVEVAGAKGMVDILLEELLGPAQNGVGLVPCLGLYEAEVDASDEGDGSGKHVSCAVAVVHDEDRAGAGGELSEVLEVQELALDRVVAVDEDEVAGEVAAPAVGRERRDRLL